MQPENEAYTEAYLDSVMPVHQMPRRWHERAAWQWVLAGGCATAAVAQGLLSQTSTAQRVGWGKHLQA